MNEIIERDPNGLDAHTPGAKLDQGKLLAGLITLWPRAIKEVLKVGTMGAKKYSRGGWQYVENGIQRYEDAFFRHIIEGAIEPYDKESGLLHKAHRCWNDLSELELILRAIENSANQARQPIQTDNIKSTEV